MKKHIRCIGVPEHFNLPWHLAIENGAFENAGITVLWNDEPKGTGAMCEALREGSTDLAVMVTTGTIRECLRNDAVKIVATYVETPLSWGIHVPKNAAINSLDDIFQPHFAISRFNSGSHLMAHYLAARNGWLLTPDSFQIVHDLNGCRKAFESDPHLIFLWEKFTTAFLVDLGEFKRIGEVQPPWPCFLIAARTDVLENELPQVKAVLNTVQQVASALMSDPNGPTLVADRYELPIERANAWWNTVKWSMDGHIDEGAMGAAADSLQQLNMINSVKNGGLSRIFAPIED